MVLNEVLKEARFKKGEKKMSEYNVAELIKLIEYQKKLLELYRKLDSYIVCAEGHHVCRFDDDEKYARVWQQIKRLENEHERSKK